MKPKDSVHPHLEVILPAARIADFRDIQMFFISGKLKNSGDTAHNFRSKIICATLAEQAAAAGIDITPFLTEDAQHALLLKKQIDCSALPVFRQLPEHMKISFQRNRDFSDHKSRFLTDLQNTFQTGSLRAAGADIDACFFVPPENGIIRSLTVLQFPRRHFRELFPPPVRQ